VVPLKRAQLKHFVNLQEKHKELFLSEWMINALYIYIYIKFEVFMAVKIHIIGTYLPYFPV
jgi:hypothetical protein